MDGLNLSSSVFDCATSPMATRIGKLQLISGDQSSFDAPFVLDRYEYSANHKLDRTRYSFIEYRVDRETKACAMYVDYTGWSMSIHIHAPRHLKKNVIRRFLRYPFHEANVKMLFAPIKSSNTVILKVARKIGFKDHCVIPDYFGLHEDQIILRAQEGDVKRWLE